MSIVTMICLVIIGICLFIQIGFLIYTCYSFYKCSEDIEEAQKRFDDTFKKNK